MDDRDYDTKMQELKVEDRSDRRSHTVWAAGIILGILGLTFILGFVAYNVHAGEMKRNQLARECIDHGGTWLDDKSICIQVVRIDTAK